MWVDYLTEFGAEVKQDVMIPTKFATSGMKTILYNMVKKGEVKKAQKEALIEPAYYSSFYGDDLSTEKLSNGNIKVKSEMYIIKCT